MSAHTPEPWKVSSTFRHDGGWDVVDIYADDPDKKVFRHIAQVAVENLTDEANARLMAEAPRMFRFIQGVADDEAICAPGENGVNLCQHYNCENVRMARAIRRDVEGAV